MKKLITYIGLLLAIFQLYRNVGFLRRSLLKLLHRLHLAYQDFEVLWLFPELLRMNELRVNGNDVLVLVETLFVLHKTKLLSLTFSAISCWCSLDCDGFVVGFFFDVSLFWVDRWASLFVAITSVPWLRSILFDGKSILDICLKQFFVHNLICSNVSLRLEGFRLIFYRHLFVRISLTNVFLFNIDLILSN